MLRPVDEIGRGGDADGVGDVVVLGVGEGVGPVIPFDDARIFDATWPLARLLGVRGGEEGRIGAAGEGRAVGAGGKAEAGGVAADLHGAGVVFGAVEDSDPAVADDRGWVEGVQRLPVHGRVRDGIGKSGELVGLDDRGLDGPGEGAEGLGRGDVGDRRGAEQRGLWLGTSVFASTGDQLLGIEVMLLQRGCCPVQVKRRRSWGMLDILVELCGIEPQTSSLRTRRSPS